MNFSEEKRKPLYVIRTPRPKSLGGQQKYGSLTMDRSEARGVMRMVKAAEINSSPELLTEAAPTTDAEAEKELIIARLKAVPEKHYRFLDGTDVTGIEAAKEVERLTEQGRYFMRLEGQVLKLAREARARGEL